MLFAKKLKCGQIWIGRRKGKFWPIAPGMFQFSQRSAWSQHSFIDETFFNLIKDLLVCLINRIWKVEIYIFEIFTAKVFSGLLFLRRQRLIFERTCSFLGCSFILGLSKTGSSFCVIISCCFLSQRFKIRIVLRLRRQNTLPLRIVTVVRKVVFISEIAWNHSSVLWLRILRIWHIFWVLNQTKARLSLKLIVPITL